MITIDSLVPGRRRRGQLLVGPHHDDAAPLASSNPRQTESRRAVGERAGAQQVRLLLQGTNKLDTSRGPGPITYTDGANLQVQPPLTLLYLLVTSR